MKQIILYANPNQAVWLIVFCAILSQGAAQSKVQNIETFNQKILEIKNSVEKLLVEQRYEKSKIENFVVAFRAQAKCSANEVSFILYSYIAQRRISSGISKVAKKIALTSEMKQAHILDVSSNKTGKVLIESRRVENALINSYEKIFENIKNTEGYLKQASNSQQLVMEKLLEITSDLDKWEDFSEVVKEIEQLIKEQRKTEKKLKSLLDPPKKNE